jgi:eukaryotic-like serine/threonine-protein kinase
MPKILAWAGPYIMAILWMLILGMLLSRVPLVKHTLGGPTSLAVSQIVRAVSYGAALFMMWMLSFRTTREIPDDGEGLTFLRSILRPLTAFMIIFAACKILLNIEASFPRSAARLSMQWATSMAMAMSAFWLTVAWVRHSNALIAFFEHQRERGAHHVDRHALTRNIPEHVSSRTIRSNSETDGTLVLSRPSPKRALGRYRIIKELGRGSMGVVYLGEDPTIHRPVAIKTMRLDQAEDPDLVKEVKTRFFHEAESTGRLSHPNIVTIYDAGEEEDLGYIAMEFLEGVTLKASCRKDHLLPVREAVNLAATVADALDYAHRQGVVHRDVKPSNIMLTNQNAIKVMDFGIARITTSTKTQTTMIMGTPSYMSPEQVIGDKVDGRADIFSLGVVLFELLTSEKPFQAENITALLFKIAHEPPQSLRAIRSDLPIRAEAIIERALQKNAAHRYQHAGELAQDLRACVGLLHA